MKLVKNGDIALIVDDNSALIFLEAVRFQQIVLCIERHECSDLQTFEALLTDFFWLFFFLKHIVVVINSPIKMIVRFSNKPNVIEPAGSLLE